MNIFTAPLRALRLIWGLMALVVLAACGGDNAAPSTPVTPVAAAPSGLTYPSATVTYTVGTAITAASPSVTGSVTSYSVSPALPAGLALSISTGQITGTPTAATAAATYTVTATNAQGSTTTALNITVNPAAPSALSYTSPQNFTTGTVITALNPTVTGTVTTYNVTPALPVGLSLNTTTGVVSGTPTTVTASAAYTVTASNVTGSTTFALTITVAAASRSWRTATLIETDDRGNAGGAAVAMDANDNAIAVWSQSDFTRFNIWTNRYVSGIGWSASASKLSPATADQVAPQVGIDSNGNAIAVWIQVSNLSNTIWASRYSGGAWSAATNIGVTPGNVVALANAFSLAVSANGSAIVVWTQSDPSSQVIRQNGWVNTFSPTGGWSTPALLQGTQDSVLDGAKAAMDANGNAVVAWTQRPDLFTLQTLKVRTYAGGAPGLIQSLDTDATDLGLGLTATGDATLVYRKRDATGLINNVLAIQSVGSSSWGTPSVLSAVGVGTAEPTVAVNATGTAIVTWSQVSNGSPQSVYATVKPTGTNWGAVRRVDTSSDVVYGPIAAVDAAGNAFVVWDQLFSGVRRAMTNRLPVGSIWGTPQQLGGGAAYEQGTTIAVSPGGNATAAWAGDAITNVSNVSSASYR